MALVFDGSVPPGQEATSGPGRAPHPALPDTIKRVCIRCGEIAISDGVRLDRDGWFQFVDPDGRETGRYCCGPCWPADEVA